MNFENINFEEKINIGDFYKEDNIEGVVVAKLGNSKNFSREILQNGIKEYKMGNSDNLILWSKKYGQFLEISHKD